MVAVGAKIAVHDPQRLFGQQLFEVFVELWHTIGIGRPADLGSTSRDQCFLRRPRVQVQASRPRSSPASGNFELESGFDSGRGDCGPEWHGHACWLGASCFYFLHANPARPLVGISVGIGSNRRRKLFQIQLVMVLGDCRPGAPAFIASEVISSRSTGRLASFYREADYLRATRTPSAILSLG